MSVLIEGLTKEELEDIFSWARIGANNRMITEGITITELPDHGDLIDLEVLRNLTGMKTNCSSCNHFGVFGCKGDISIDYICGVLDDMPVVIPEERSVYIYKVLDDMPMVTPAERSEE